MEKQLQTAVLRNNYKLEFCFLAQKSFLLHGTHFPLSVPFEDIFQDNVAIDLHSFSRYILCLCLTYFLYL